MNRRVVVELLDSGQSHPLQSWTFSNQDRILIGRSPENDVVLGDPYVSRSHAYLQFDQIQWRVVSISSQQVVHQGEKRAELSLVDQDVFRLGAAGCFLRFSHGAGAEAPVTGMTTLGFDSLTTPIFHLDQSKTQREVEEITGSDYFQSLKQRALLLRNRR